MKPANPHEQPDHPIDPAFGELEALLAEEAARGHETPAELEAKVLALTDPGLLTLLDEALAPQQTPDQLADRIIAATSPRSATQAAPELEPRSAVLARIEPAGWRYAAAAAIVLAAGVGLWWAGQHAPVDSTIPDFSDQLLDWEDQEETQQLFAEVTDDLETKLQDVAAGIDAYAGSDDSIWSDMDGYEDFLLALEPQT